MHYETAEKPNRSEQAVLNTLRPNGAGAVVEAPDYLDEIERRYWARYGTTYPTLLEDDPELLESFCIAAALVERCKRDLNENGVRTKNAGGKQAANVLLNPMRAAMRDKRDLAEKIRKRHQPAVKGTDGFA